MSKRHYFHSLQGYKDLESSNLNKYILTLETKVEEKSNSPISENLFFIPDKPKNSKKDYMEELKKQMDQKQLKKKQEIQEKTSPGINENYHGYPNLPQTPREIRRKREISQMNEFRKDLTDQIAVKNQQVNILKNIERESERNSNLLDYQKYIDDKKNKELAKENQKEALVSSWNQAKKARELQCALESADRRGVKPVVSQSLRNVEISQVKKTEDESSQFNAELENKTLDLPKGDLNQALTSLKKGNAKERAKKLKENLEILEKNSYQFKIKELVKDAKKQRELLKPPFKKSVSPGIRQLYEGKPNAFVSHKTFKLYS